MGNNANDAISKPVRGKTRYLYSVAIFSLCIPCSAAYAQSDKSNQGLGEIVVTAQKREEDLQKVPVAVTALSKVKLDNLQVQNFNDLGGLAPSLYSVQTSSSSQPTITLRGIVGSNTASGVDASVALYVDGVYLSRYLGAAFDVADLERVEVLRGPQGTLYGRNSTGGAINYITAPPKGQFYARQEVTAGNLGRIRTKTRIDSPKIGAFSISVAFLHDQEDGYARNTEAGEVWNFDAVTRNLMTGDRVSPKRLGGNNSEAGRIAIRYAPDSIPLTVDYKFDITHARYTNPPTQVLGFASGGLGPTAELIYGLQPVIGGGGVVSLTRLDAVPNGYTTPEILHAFGHSLTATLNLADHLQLKSITGYRGFTDTGSSSLDGDGSLVDPFGGTGQTYHIAANSIYERSRQFSEEMQVSYNSHLVDLIGGLYFFREHVTSISPTFFLQTVSSDLAAPGSANGPMEYSDAVARNKSYAAYGQSTIHLSDKLDLTGGARVTKDKRHTISRTTFFGTPVPGLEKTYNHIDWTANLTYRPTNAITLYSKAGTGYLSGGIFNGFAFRPEKLTQYEIGAKTDFLEHRLRVNLSGYHSDYRDLITGAVDSRGIFVYENAGKARINGFEAEISALPVSSLTLSANYGLTDFKYLEFMQGGIDVSKTTKRTYTPKHTLSLSAEYRFAALNSGIKPSINLDAQWHSNLNLVPNSYNPALQSVLDHNAFWNLEARASLADIRMGTGKAKISLWVRNLLNKRTIVQATDLTSVITGTFNRPRTYGGDFIVEF